MTDLDAKGLLAAFRANHHPDAEPSSVELSALSKSIRAYLSSVLPPPCDGAKALKDAGLTSPDGTFVHGPTQKVVAALSAPCDGVGVRELVWDRGNGIDASFNYFSAADGFGGRYTVFEGQWSHAGVGITGHASDDEAAKAATQADYSRRIRSALTADAAKAGAEPVAGEAVAQWQVISDEGAWVNEDADMIEHWRSQGRPVRPLYASPVPAAVERGTDESFPDALPDEQIRIWINACNHEPARQALRQLLAYRIRGVSQPLRALSIDGETEAARRKFSLWFFRDLAAVQRGSLFALFGYPVEEMGTHGREQHALPHLLDRLSIHPQTDAKEE